MSMKRVPIFLLLGPTLVVLVALSREAIASGRFPTEYIEGCVMLFVFSWIVCAVAASVDGVLAYVTPIYLRAPLIAIVGAAVAVGLRLYLQAQHSSKAASSSLYAGIPIAVIVVAATGALTAGACSLLSHDYRRWNA
jgi:hypothetical protein